MAYPHLTDELARVMLALRNVRDYYYIGGTSEASVGNSLKPTSYLADFDSAAAMLRALANYLQGQDFPLLGALPRWRAHDMKVFAAVVNLMPKSMKEQVYIWSGWFEAV